MSPSSQDKLAELRRLLERYRALPRHAHPELLPQLASIRKLQVKALRAAHAKDCREPRYAAHFAFYLDELHSGLPLNRLAAEGDSIVQRLARADRSYELIRSTFDFSVTAQELDDALALRLHSKRAMPAALRAGGQHGARRAHAHLLTPLGPALAKYAHSRLAAVGFKLGMSALRRTAFQPLVGTMERGFAALRELPDVEDAFRRLIVNNLKAINSLYREE